MLFSELELRLTLVTLSAVWVALVAITLLTMTRERQLYYLVHSMVLYFELTKLEIILHVVMGPASIICCKLTYSPANRINDVICQGH